MSGGWIKMRGALIDHPKVIALTRLLRDNNDYCNWLTPGARGSATGQIVSSEALRCVTTSLLLRVWSTAREHGDFEGDDLLLPHNCVADLDEMVGVPGFGAAMLAIGWVMEREGAPGIFLPNFKEFNVPKSAKEKQQDYRNRKKLMGSIVTQPLPTASNETGQIVTTRGEESRTKNTTRGQARTSGVFVDNFSLPDWVPLQPWIKFTGTRKKLKKPLNADSAQLIVDELARLGQKGQDIAAVLEQSVRNDYADVFPVKVKTEGAQAGISWRKTEQGRIAKGREFGIFANPGESNESFMSRIDAAMSKGQERRVA